MRKWCSNNRRSGGGKIPVHTMVYVELTWRVQTVKATVVTRQKHMVREKKSSSEGKIKQKLKSNKSQGRKCIIEYEMLAHFQKNREMHKVICKGPVFRIKYCIQLMITFD